MKKYKGNELVKAANDFVRGHNALVKTQSDKLDEFRTNQRHALYDNLALAYALALEMRDEANAEAVAELFAARRDKKGNGISAKLAPGANPFLPIVKALFGKWDNPDKLNDAWIWDRSAEKYANVFRLASSLNPPRTPELFAHWLKTAEHGAFGKGITAAEKQDRKLHGRNDPRAEKALQADIGIVLGEPPIATIDLAGIELSDLKARYVCVWGLLDEDAQLKVMGELPKMEASIGAMLRRDAPEIAAKIAKRRLTAETKAAGEAKRAAQAPAKPSKRQAKTETVSA